MSVNSVSLTSSVTLRVSVHHRSLRHRSSVFQCHRCQWSLKNSETLTVNYQRALSVTVSATVSVFSVLSPTPHIPTSGQWGWKRIIVRRICNWIRKVSIAISIEYTYTMDSVIGDSNIKYCVIVEMSYTNRNRTRRGRWNLYLACEWSIPESKKDTNIISAKICDSDIQLIIIVEIGNSDHVWSRANTCWILNLISKRAITISKIDIYMVNDMIGNNHIEPNVIVEISDGDRSRTIIIFNWIFGC